MKKTLSILVLLALLTACNSTVEFQKNCTIKNTSPDIIDTENRQITYNNLDKVTKVEITRQYQAKNDQGITIINNIKEAMQSCNNNLLKSKNIKIEIIKDTEKEYKIIYYLDVQKLNNEELKKFNLNKNSIKLFKNLNKNKIKCN